MTTFIPGLQLSEQFYHEAVRPILDAQFAGLAYSAALIGPGSEVIGCDTPRSTDHDWGPRLLLFLSEDDYGGYASAIYETLRWHLPPTFRGYSTHFSRAGDNGARTLETRATGPVDHRVVVHTLPRFCAHYLGHDLQTELTAADWLTFSEHKLLTLTSGQVFYDGLGVLEPMRQRLAYYPHDVWLYLMASQWQMISQEEPFVGRAGEVGDDLGSRLIAARLVQEVMELCFLIERRYRPYSKWLGTVFNLLACAPRLRPILGAVLQSLTWSERQEHLARAYSVVAEMHNALGLTSPLSTEAVLFYDRPFLVIYGDRFAQAIAETITDPQVRAIDGLIGSANQFVASVDLLEESRRCRRLRTVYLSED